MGIIPYAFDTSQPSYGIPKDVTIHKVDNNILDFLKNSSKHQQHIVNKIRECHGSIVWDECGDNSIKIDCTLNKNTKDLITLSTRWENIMKEVVNELLDEYFYCQVTPYQEAEDKFMNEARSILVGRNDDIILRLDNDSGVASVVGKREECYELKKKLTAIHESVLQEMENQKRVITEEMKELTPLQLEILRTNHIYADIEKTCDGLKVEERDGILHLIGLPIVIKEAKISILKFLTECDNRTHPLSSLLNSLVSCAKVQTYLKEAIAKKLKELIVLEFSQNKIVVHGHNKVNLSEIMSYLHSELYEEKLECTAEVIEALMSKEWAEACTDIEKTARNYTKIDVVKTGENEGILSVVATSNVIDDVKKKISKYLDKHVKATKFISMQLGVLKVLETHMSRELMKAVYEVSAKIHLEPCFTSDSPGYELIGTEEEVRYILRAIKDVSEKVYSEKQVIKNMGIEKILTNKKGRDRLDGIESRHKVIIEMEATLTGQLQGAAGSPTVLYSSQISPKTAILIKHGDIVKDNVDAIVNPANARLMHGGGLARVISHEGKFNPFSGGGDHL